MPAASLRGQNELRRLAVRLRDAGSQGQGLKRALYKAVGDAAKPLAEEIGSTANLDSHLPDRYAAVLAADLSVTTAKRLTPDPAVTIRIKGRTHNRQVRSLEAGRMRHPVYARDGVPRRQWTWRGQTGGLKSGFATDPLKEYAPGIRNAVIAAVRDIEYEITGG